MTTILPEMHHNARFLEKTCIMMQGAAASHRGRLSGPTALVEIKSTDRVEARHVRDLQRFLPDFPGAMPVCLSRDPLRRQLGDVLALPWQDGLSERGL